MSERNKAGEVELRQKLAMLEEDLEEEKETMYAINSSMTS